MGDTNLGVSGRAYDQGIGGSSSSSRPMTSVPLPPQLSNGIPSEAQIRSIAAYLQLNPRLGEASTSTRDAGHQLPVAARYDPPPLYPQSSMGHVQPLYDPGPIGEYVAQYEVEQSEEEAEEVTEDVKAITGVSGKKKRKRGPTLEGSPEAVAKQRKESHKEVERRRREAINEKIEQLKTIIPDGRLAGGKKVGKADILTATHNLIEELTSENRSKMEVRERLRIQSGTARGELGVLQTRLAISHQQ